MKAAVCIPHRGIDVHRQANLDYTVNRWTGFGLPVFYADSDEGPFNRSQAINRAVARSKADVYVIADNDVVLETSQQAWESIEDAYTNDFYTVCFSKLNVLDWEASAAVRAGGKPQEQFVLESVRLVWSNCFAISRVLFERVGGFDERFVGYGHQDGAFLNACSTLGGKNRVNGNAYHLRHPDPDKDHMGMRGNVELAIRYRQADGDVEAMLALVGER
jgi:hypothetical protein